MSRTKVLALTRYSRLGASSRVRTFQYQPFLQKLGVDLHIEPLFSDAYVLALQQGKRSLFAAMAAYLRRIGCLMSDRSGFDLVLIEKESLPWIPFYLERLIGGNKLPFVLDYDDAVFHHYESHRHPWIGRLLANKHQDLMQYAAMVIAGNQYIANYAVSAGARKIKLLPTVIDIERYSMAKTDRCGTSETPTVGWIGQRATARFLKPLANTFHQLSSEMQFKAIGINAQELNLPMESEDWHEDTEVASIQGLDIGIMPLSDEPFERGKCGYKLIQYMACGLPVVASPVGANAVIVEHGVNGFLATTPAEWETALRALAADPLLRQRMGEAGRAKVEREFCLQVTASRMARWLQQVADAKGT